MSLTTARSLLDYVKRDRRANRKRASSSSQALGFCRKQVARAVRHTEREAIEEGLEEYDTHEQECLALEIEEQLAYKQNLLHWDDDREEERWFRERAQVMREEHEIVEREEWAYRYADSYDDGY